MKKSHPSQPREHGPAEMPPAAGASPPPISQRQNEPHMRELLKAASAANVREQRLEALRVTLSLALAAGSVFAAFASVTAPVITVVGASWALAYAVLVSPLAKRQARRSAVIQEMFDTVLFGLPWNDTLVGTRLRLDEISRLVREFDPRRGRVRRLHDWYVDTSNVPRPYDIFVCQQQNLAWDARLRRRWAWILLTTVVLWMILGLIVGYAIALTIPETLLRWYVPSLAALIYGIDGYKNQRGIAAERERVTNIVQTEIDNAQPAPTPDEHARMAVRTREVQNVIFTTRMQVTRVPDWFYARFRTHDEKDFHSNAEHLREKFETLANPGGTDKGTTVGTA